MLKLKRFVKFKFIITILFVLIFGVESNAQNEVPFFQFGITGGLNVSKLQRDFYIEKVDTAGNRISFDKLPNKNVGLPHFGVNALFNFNDKLSLRTGLQYSYRGSNYEKPSKKYRINFYDIYLMPGFNILPSFRFEAGIQYSILYTQYYKIINGSFSTGEERIKITDYKSRPEFMVGLDLRLQKNLSIYSRYTIPNKNIESNNLQFGISVIINNSSNDGNSGKTARSLEQILANPLAYTKLILHRQNLTELPADIGKCLNLETLLVNGNFLKTLPKEIGNLVNLKLLEVSYNELESLPNEIGNLSNLEFLRINNNKLKHLPPQIGMLEKLRFFTIGKNELEFLPDEIGNLSNLNELNIVSSGLMKLPTTIVNLKKLEYLYISNPDVLTVFPSSINPRLVVYLNGSRL